MGVRHVQEILPRSCQETRPSAKLYALRPAFRNGCNARAESGRPEPDPGKSDSSARAHEIRFKSDGRADRIHAFGPCRAEVGHLHQVRWHGDGLDSGLVQKRDRKSVVWGKSVSVRVDIGGSRTIKK